MNSRTWWQSFEIGWLHVIPRFCAYRKSPNEQSIKGVEPLKDYIRCLLLLKLSLVFIMLNAVLRLRTRGTPTTSPYDTWSFGMATARSLSTHHLSGWHSRHCRRCAQPARWKSHARSSWWRSVSDSSSYQQMWEGEGSRDAIAMKEHVNTAGSSCQ